MIVYKFGGASVKNAEAVKNVVKIIRDVSNGPVIVVVSAMGKMTNALEVMHQNRLKGSFDPEAFNHFQNYHIQIARELFEKEGLIFNELNDLFSSLESLLKSPIQFGPAREYDQIVCFGELLSTKIVEAYCKKYEMDSIWLDVRKLLVTDSNFQYANVNWGQTGKNWESFYSKTQNKVFITQGFIGADANGNSTSLGREGSDFSAAILAYVSNASSTTIWKDVPGMLNADPKFFKETIKLHAISYREAIELSYYGASVIHPKTVKPLENKKIPLYIKSFENPSLEGTIIQKSAEYDALVPSFIFKEGQSMVSISPKDFSFIEEEQLGVILQAIFNCGIKLNLMQNSALSLTLVFDEDEDRLERLMDRLSSNYSVKFNLGLKLLNIRHYNDETISRLTAPYDVLIKQQTRVNVRMVVKDRAISSN